MPHPDQSALPPLDEARLTELAAPWQVRVVAETESTNLDLLDQARHGAAEGSVLAAEFQRTGRGRLDRRWTSAPRSGLTVSFLLRPAVPPATWGWLPLMAGVCLADTVGAGARLKWPNDLLLGSGKAAGILAQVGGGAVVIGIGLNVHAGTAELGAPSATSLASAGLTQLDRTQLLITLLGQFWQRYDRWQAAEGDAQRSGLAPDYERLCATVGSQVRVELGESELTGLATGIDVSGRLLVLSGDAEVAVAAGDVIHLRPA